MYSERKQSTILIFSLLQIAAYAFQPTKLIIHKIPVIRPQSSYYQSNDALSQNYGAYSNAVSNLPFHRVQSTQPNPVNTGMPFNSLPAYTQETRGLPTSTYVVPLRNLPPMGMRERQKFWSRPLQYLWSQLPQYPIVRRFAPYGRFRQPFGYNRYPLVSGPFRRSSNWFNRFQSHQPFRRSYSYPVADYGNPSTSASFSPQSLRNVAPTPRPIIVPLKNVIHNGQIRNKFPKLKNAIESKEINNIIPNLKPSDFDGFELIAIRVWKDPKEKQEDANNSLSEPLEDMSSRIQGNYENTNESIDEAELPFEIPENPPVGEYIIEVNEKNEAKWTKI